MSKPHYSYRVENKKHDEIEKEILKIKIKPTSKYNLPNFIDLFNFTIHLIYYDIKINSLNWNDVKLAKEIVWSISR